MSRPFHLNSIDFEWNDVKATTNVQKHKIAFKVACEVFFDPFLKPLSDELIDGEFRDRVIGRTGDWRLLYVVYVIRGERVQIISARRATKVERKQYEIE